MKKINPVFLFLMFLCLFSCGQKGSKAVDFNQIRPKSDYQTQKKVKDTDSSAYVLETFKIDSVLLSFDALSIDSSVHFLDRFSLVLNKAIPGGVIPNYSKWILSNKNENVNYNQWRFKDSLVRKNAFYNWMDNYGPNRRSIEMFQATKLANNNLLLLINQKSIVAIESNQIISRKKWEAYQRFYYPKDSIVYVISQIKDKKCIWYQRKGKYIYKNISK